MTDKPNMLKPCDLPEAPWITEMRRHFAEHGFYRTEDLHRLLEKPGQSVVIVDGKEDGSPLLQAWRAMIDAALASEPKE